MSSPRYRRLACTVALLSAFVGMATAFAVPVLRFAGAAVIDVDPTFESVAAQLGVRVPREYAQREFEVGTQFTGVLQEPKKLVAFGIKGMHAGARVVAARVGEDRIYIEADELDPPARASIHVRLRADGNVASAASE